MRPINSYFQDTPPLLESTDPDGIDAALSLEVTEYASFHSQLELCDMVHDSNIRARLWTFRDQMLAKNDAQAFLTVNGYIKYEEYLRAGSSGLQAGRMVATTFFARGASSNFPSLRNKPILL